MPGQKGGKRLEEKIQHAAPQPHRPEAHGLPGTYPNTSQRIYRKDRCPRARPHGGRGAPTGHRHLLQLRGQGRLAGMMPDLSGAVHKRRIGTAKFFTLLLLLYLTQTKSQGFKFIKYSITCTCNRYKYML